VKVVQVCVYEDGGGAPRAAARLNQALRAAGCDSRMYVLYRNAGRPETVQYQPPPGLVPRLLERYRRHRIARARGRYHITGGCLRMYLDTIDYLAGRPTSCFVHPEMKERTSQHGN
jgi:hypothetical protein